MVPAIMTSPWASKMTGVLALLRVNFTVTLTGTVTEVKLKMPLAGSATVCVQVGFGVQVVVNGPSAPVLPLLYVWARAGLTLRTDSAAALERICLILLVMTTPPRHRRLGQHLEDVADKPSSR
jgi:hypothetical protein